MSSKPCHLCSMLNIDLQSYLLLNVHRQFLSSAQQSGYAKEPATFDGNPAFFKEWSLSMELAFRSLSMSDPVQIVNYAAGYLSGNVKLWLIVTLEAGSSPQSWPALKNALPMCTVLCMIRRGTD